MRSYLVVLLLTPVVVVAFGPQQTGRRRPDTSLNVIGPMIKRMREADAKKRMPMANPKEAEGQAPGLRVGARAWKWPPIWPYDQSFFINEIDSAKQQKKPSFGDVTSMVTGIAQVPTTVDEEKEEKFDPIKFWGQDNKDAKTVMDAESIEKLKEHYAFYLQDGMSVLEFGAAEDSYLPIKPSRHVGVGANMNQMEANPSLTERMIVNLDKVVEGRDVDDDDLRRLASDPFDCIITSNTVPYLSNPREVFRTAWYLLKPGGIMIVSFAGKEATKDQFPEAQTRIWRDYNDDQHIWISGSFFQFSAGDGWTNLMGFDISPESAKDADTGDNPVAKLLKKGKNNNYFVVQAVKGFQDESIDPDNSERSIDSMCWMLPKIEARDKNLVVPRLARAFDTAENEKYRKAIENNLQYLPTIYESLTKMDKFAFTFSMQAQLAAELVCDPSFEANEEQMSALQQGLGLKPPSKEFWEPIGRLTSAMDMDDRISLLGYIVPRFGSNNDAAQIEAINAFVTGLEPTFSIIREKCPSMKEGQIQLLGTELLAREILQASRSTRLEFAKWLGAATGDDLQEWLSNRQEVRVQAQKDLIVYKEEKAAEAARLADYQRQMNEQMEQARQNRSLVFNPRTEKMEILKRE